MGVPDSNPVPASPTTCSDPMLEAKIEAPITNHPTFLPAKK